MSKPKSLTVIICADVQITDLSEVPYRSFLLAEDALETYAGQLLNEFFPKARVHTRYTIIKDQPLAEIIRDDDA